MAKTADFGTMEQGDKVRLVLRMKPSMKDALVGKARDLGVSPSAYVALLVNQDLKPGGYSVG